jgi:class 3 adenylate cyclase
MQVCASCGKESEKGFAFCPHCGVRLAAERIQRKIVTVLFCDVVGSTASGEFVDAETTRSPVADFFVRMKGIVEAHGGSSTSSSAMR